MIEIKDITKSFGNKTIIKDITATFYPGKTNLIIGQSGSGKSVTVKCMVGLHPVDKGEIYYSGKDFIAMDFKQKKELRQEIGMLFQGGALFDSLNVEENILFPLSMFTDESRSAKMDRVNFCLKRVKLENVNKLFPSEISGGMKKRVAIARAIAMNPKYLFCDEPNSGLDPQTSIVIDNLIKELTEEYNMTTIVITHDMNSVMEIGDNIIFIHNGQKWWEGSNEDILKTDNKEINDFVYASSYMKKLKQGNL